jgi:flagellar hook-associated protein 3 FlgL
MYYNQFLSDLQKNLSAMYDANEQLSTGKRVNRPSDDPAAMARIVGYKATLSSFSQYSRAIDSAKSALGAIDSSFTNLEELMTRANELAVEGATATVDANARRGLASEISGLLESAKGIANTQVGNRYIFSGYSATTPPIDMNTGEFIGDSNIFQLDISQHVKIAINIPASELFSYKLAGSGSVLPSYSTSGGDPAGALVTPSGSFTDPATDVFSTVGGNLTISLGSTSVTANLNAGPYTLNDMADAINASSLNTIVTASVVNVGSTTSPDYRLVFAPLQTGRASELQLSATPAGGDIGFSALNTVTMQKNINNYNYFTDPSDANYNSFNNNYLNENNILRALSFLNQALQNNDAARVSKAIDYISNVSEKIYQLHADVGARLNKLDAEANYLGDREEDTQVNLSHDQDADLAKTVTDIQQRQNALDSLRTVSQQIFSSSLFDFIK